MGQVGGADDGPITLNISLACRTCFFFCSLYLTLAWLTEASAYNMLTTDLSWLDLALLCHPILALLPNMYFKAQTSSSRRKYLALSFFTLLAYRYLAIPSATATPFNATQPDAPLCKTHDAPNPIARLYPGNATGTLNGTVAILPIPLALARSLIPSQYTILTAAYQALLPSLPSDMYPAVLQAVHDHEVQAFGYLIPDFSRAGIEFPFLDLLGDGSTSFKWAPTLLMTAGHEIAIKGAQDYGTNTFASAFDPQCDAYRSVEGQPGASAFNARGENGTAFVDTLFEKTERMVFGLEFFRNVTNQPTFADGKTCDNMIRLFNTSVTTSIESVKGSVRAKLPPFKGEEIWDGAEGIRLDSAFIENNYLPCENFRGYGSS